MRRPPAPTVPRRLRGQPVELITARLVLREITGEDRVALEALAADPRLLAHVPAPARALAAAARTRPYLPRRRRAYDLAVILRRGGRLIGACDLSLTGPRRADIGYLLSPRHWGRGYGSEVARALVEFAFATLGLRQVSAVVAVENERSRRVLEKAGLRWDGYIRRHSRYAGRWHDCHCYVIERSGWDAAPPACAPRPPLRS